MALFSAPFFCFGLLVLQCFFAPAFAAPDDDFLAARDAYNAHHSARLDQFAAKLQHHLLAPFVQYWQLALNIDSAQPDEVQAFLAKNSDSYLADRLRMDWLKSLGRQKRWDLFLAQYPQLVNEDNNITCYQLQARLETLPSDLGPLTEAKRLWFTGSDLPDNCNPLFERLADEKLLRVDDVFVRLRLALEAGNVSVARYTTQYLPHPYQGSLKPLEAVAENPARFLEKNVSDLSTRGARELALFAIYRIARTDTDNAISHWERIKARFSAEDQAYEAGQIAFYLARSHAPNALAWYGYAKAAPLNDLQLGWKARAAMRAQNWPELLAAIDAMTETEQRRTEWRYWKARALKADGRPVAANEIFLQLSRETNFYAQLANEELGAVIGPIPTTYKPTEAEINAIAAVPAIQRALALYRLNMRTEGLREWTWTIRKYDDKQLLAAAELAQRNDLYDRSINSADRTQQLHDFSLRYPAPHLETMHTYTKPLNLDDAWVYGLVRQESRFITVAKSSVGASGMMQLMPATARLVAKKMGMKGFHAGVVSQLETNFALGTYYLKHVQDLLNGNAVLATAAYNAGPSRARKWQDDKPMDAAAYIESIPFNETRDYVKKVMSNSAYYAARFGNSLTSLKQRIGIIPGKRNKAEDLSDEP
jgi:soluble lytic murein transglycosylase